MSSAVVGRIARYRFFSPTYIIDDYRRTYLPARGLFTNESQDTSHVTQYHMMKCFHRVFVLCLSIRLKSIIIINDLYIRVEHSSRII